MPHALVVEDDAASLAGLVELVAQEGFSTAGAKNLEVARARLRERRPDIVLTDLRLPDGEGLDLLAEFDGDAGTETVVITAHASVETAVKALRLGAVDYLTKPIDVPRLKTVLAGIARTRELKEEIGALRETLRDLGRFGRLVGDSPAMQAVYDMITKVAPTSASVLITGESGTGKELVAETIHELSRRRRGPYLAVNCGAISPTLIESELFGHEKGSFTGAAGRHRGPFERASGGTLLLDEIGEMPIESQVKLLRALESGRITRVGGGEEFAVDVRIIAATNRDPRDLIASGLLREDLFYRLSVFPIEIPPLRERGGEDTEMLVAHFLQELSKEAGTRRGLTQPALQRLLAYDWPGNVRELRNVVHRAFIMAEDRITTRCLSIGAPAPGVGNTAPRIQIPVGSSTAEAEKKLILATLDHFGGNKKKTAETLGVSLKTLYTRLNRYGAR